MAKLQNFIDYLNSHVNRAIYVWGAQGQIATEAWIKAKESGNDEKRALKLFRKRKKAGVDPIYAYDCSGLGMDFFIDNGIFKSDMTANGMKGKCTLIQKNHLKKGCWVFRTYKTEASAKKNGKKKGDAYHIGYIVDDKLNVVHAKGRDHGVVKEKFSASYWNTYGAPNCFADEMYTKEEQAEHAAFNRDLKKGCKGDDVRELQKLLKGAGYNIAVDGSFGNETRTAVRSFQTREGLKVDGIAGPITIKALQEAQKPDESTDWIVTRQLKKGCEGEDVKEMQKRLINAGYSCGKDGADGDFGSVTYAAVRVYQKAKGLKIDGIAGKNTITALGGIYKE